MQKIQIAADKVALAAKSAETSTTKPRKVITHAVIDEPKFKVDDFLWRSSLGAFGFVAEIITMVFLTYFILLSGDTPLSVSWLK